MFSKVLLPLDGSDTALAALPVALELAHRFGGRLLLVQVVETETTALAIGANAITGTLVDPRAIGADVDAHVAAARAYLAATAEQTAARGVATDYEVRDGPAAEAIVDAAVQNQADVIVICSHGRGGLGRLVLGSTTEAIIRRAPIPVLVVRARPEATR
jgi:nucleotide-binding universal stress UspA family protein